MKSINEPSDLVSAFMEAIRECRTWMDGAVVARMADGSYEAMPPSYVTGSTFADDIDHIVLELTDPAELFGNDADDLGWATDEELRTDVQWLLNEYPGQFD